MQAYKSAQFEVGPAAWVSLEPAYKALAPSLDWQSASRRCQTLESSGR